MARKKGRFCSRTVRSNADFQHHVSVVHSPNAVKAPDKKEARQNGHQPFYPPKDFKAKLTIANVNGQTLQKAERLVLAALSQYPQGRNKVQLALLTGYAHSGGAFRNALGALRSKGFIEGDNSHMEITPEGDLAVGHVDPLPTGVNLLRHWQSQLGNAEREILDALYEAHPKPLTKTEIAEATPSRYQYDGGAFRNALGRLRTLELVQGRREMKLSEALVNVA